MRMNPLIFIRFFLMLILLNYGSLQAQSQYIPNIIPPSPNAASLMKFTDVPVSPYSGTADITVPIYTIQARGLNIPVNLSYHTGGVRIKDESGWVGLGWALSAGGSISRIIQDKDDFNSGTPYFTTNVPQLAGDMSQSQVFQGSTVLSQYFFDFFCSYLVDLTTGTEDYTNALDGGLGLYDIEPDIYYYNFAGHSGKFIMLRNRQVALQKQDNIRIQVDNAGNTFTITDESGNNFIFQDRDSSGSAIGPANTYSTSSWNLSKIITQQNDTVSFTYTSDNTWTYVASDIYETVTAECSNAQGDVLGNGPGAFYLNKTLQSINFSNGQLQFVFDGNRSDLLGGKKLDAIKLFSKTGSTLNYIKEHDFFYSYFDALADNDPVDSFELKRLRLDSVKEISGAGYNMPPYSFQYFPEQGGKGTLFIKKHGACVDHWGYYNGNYNTSFIPTIPSTMFEPPTYNSASGSYYSRLGAYREPDPSAYFTEIFALQQINYPTGGKTVLTYEQNTYDDNNSRTSGAVDFPIQTTKTVDTSINIGNNGTFSGVFNLANIYPQLGPGAQTINLTLDVAFIGSGNTTVDYHKKPSGLIYFTFNAPGTGPITEDITNSALNCGTTDNVCSISIPMTIIGTPSNCTWTAYIDPSVSFTYFSEINVSLSYQELLTVYNNNPTLTASGLRIKTITDYSSTNSFPKQRVYNYNYMQDKLGTGVPQQYTYGRLMSYPDYMRYTLTPYYANGNEYKCTSLTIYGSSYSPLTSVIAGNIVGYDQVSETELDLSTNTDIGKTVYTYFNSPDTGISYGGFRLPGTFNIGNNLNGSLLSKTEYVNSNGTYLPVSSTVNSYHLANRFIYYTPKLIAAPVDGSGGTGGAQSCSPGGTPVSVEMLGCFYPSIKSERLLLDATQNYAYDQANPSNYVLTTKNFYYDNPVHYLLTRTNLVDSKGNSLTTLQKYPQDYIPTGQTWTGNTIIDTMIGRNIVSEVIEKQNSLFYAGSQTAYITGAQLTLFRILSSNLNTVVPDKIYKLDVQSPITNFQPFSFSLNTTSMDSRNRLMASFDQYDTRNNMQQYTTTDQNSVSVIWDYLNKYPIAQVKNAVITDVAATSFEADGYGNWSPFTGVITTVTSSPFPPTGINYYNITPIATLNKSGLVSGNIYIISYWSLNGVYSITGGSGSYITGKTINGWTYYEHKITTSSTTLTISGTGAIDEVRLYPSTALMTTYTYAPLLGTTTTCDQDNKVTYYFYDGLGRLKWVKDQDGNIIKTYQYHYQGGTTQY